MGSSAVRMEAFVTMMLTATILVAVAGQQQVPSCAQKLVPCASYIASPKPPESCCGPIKEAVKDELPCLCSLFKSPQLIAAFNINLTQALQLPKNCGIQSNQPLCNSTTTTISPAKGSPAPSSSTTPTSPSSNIVNPGKASHSSSSMGISGLAGLFVLWCAVGA